MYLPLSEAVGACDPERACAPMSAATFNRHPRCSDIYHGTTFLSAPETKAIDTYAKSVEGRIAVTMDIHAYGQVRGLLCCPLAICCSVPSHVVPWCTALHSYVICAQQNVVLFRRVCCAITFWQRLGHCGRLCTRSAVCGSPCSQTPVRFMNTL